MFVSVWHGNKMKVSWNLVKRGEKKTRHWHLLQIRGTWVVIVGDGNSDASPWKCTECHLMTFKMPACKWLHGARSFISRHVEDRFPTNNSEARSFLHLLIPKCQSGIAIHDNCCFNEDKYVVRLGSRFTSICSLLQYFYTLVHTYLNILSGAIWTVV